MRKIDAEKEIRRFRRFRGYDYSRGAAIFITIVTNPRRRLFPKAGPVEALRVLFPVIHIVRRKNRREAYA